MQQFPHSQNLVITGGCFNQVHQDNNYGGSGRDTGLLMLKQHIATDAIFDSAERFPPPKCHPGTRRKIMNTIMDWINQPEPSSQALWLYGPAGAGKSAIAHSIAVMLQAIIEESKYAASFFFARDAVGRGDGNKLFATIAYQIALSFPSFRLSLDAIMLENPTLPTKSIDVQLRYLIIEPLKRIVDWPRHTPIVIIDGLDECSGSKQIQSLVLFNISHAIIEHRIPLRFLIVSRPEYWISDYFKSGPLSSVAKLISMIEDKSADDDVRLFLEEEFARIYEENLALMGHISRPWPPDYIMNQLVRKASGQFIYASTVIKFVGNSSNFCDPQEQLRMLTQSEPHESCAFSDLDKLYTTILSAYPRQETLRRVLGGLMVGMDQRVIQEFLEVPATEIQLVSKALSSLINVPEHTYPDAYRALEPIFGSFAIYPRIDFCHLSITEFLQTKSRSGQYAVDKTDTMTRLICFILRVGSDTIEGHPDVEQVVSRIGLTNYRNVLLRFGVSLLDTECDYSAVLDVLGHFSNIIQDLLYKSLVHIPHASHVLWFTSSLLQFLPSFRSIVKRKRLQDYKTHKSLLSSMTYMVEIVRTISAKQVFEDLANNMKMPTFAYLASHSIRTQDDQTFIPITNLSKAMNISISTIILELQCLQDLSYFSLSPGRPEEAEICFSGRLFAEDLYEYAIYNVEPQQILSWDNDRIKWVSWSLTRLLQEPWHYRLDECLFDVVHFLESKRLSDIQSKEYFQDADKMAILHLILSLPCLENLTQDARMTLTTAELAWLNRQLETSTSRAVIAQYDTLYHAMQYATRSIFQTIWLPQFIGPYSSTLCMENDRSFSCVYLHISPRINDGACSIVEDTDFVIENWHNLINDYSAYPIYRNITTFNEKVIELGKGELISPSDWYPHLAVFLLTMLVKKQYGTLNDGFEESWVEVTMKCFNPLTQCLPYAIPTYQNLNAIRALHYLCPKIHPTLQWRPPSGFCSLTINFLKKYDESVLPRQEFNRLEHWLLGLKDLESIRILMDYDDSCLAERDDYSTDEDEE